MKCQLFVYGTLRYLEKNHRFIKNEFCIAQQAWVNGRLYQTSHDYPAMILGDERVYGELYEIDEALLFKIHELEGCSGPESSDNLFDFVPVRVYTDVKEYDAFSYVMNPEKVENKQEIISGDWKEHHFGLKKSTGTLYFAYGSCMDAERFRKAAVDHHFIDVVGCGKLENYSVKFTVTMEDGGRADLVEDGGSAEGILYRVPSEAVEYLYLREGVDSKLYRPAFVSVEVNGMIYEQCLTFTVIHKKDEYRPPDHYSAEILRGAEGRLGAEYIQKIRDYMEGLPYYKP